MDKVKYTLKPDKRKYQHKHEAGLHPRTRTHTMSKEMFMAMPTRVREEKIF
jgi:hypothetical protein